MNQLLQKHNYKIVDGIYSKGEISGTVNTEIYDSIGGTDLYKRSKVKGTHSYYEQPFVLKYLNENVDKNVNTILDLGCGDGRATEWFLVNTNAKVVACDSCFESLIRLRNNFKHFDKVGDRLFILHENLENLNFFNEAFDVIWSFEVLYYLDNDFPKGIEICSKLLNKNGVLINGERDFQSGLLYELLNKGPDGFRNSATNKKLYDKWGEHLVSTSLFETEYIIKLIESSGLSFIKKSGIPFWGMIFSFMQWKDLFKEEILNDSEGLIETIDQLGSENQINRVNLFYSRKIK